jgi:hypothetical protein
VTGTEAPHGWETRAARWFIAGATATTFAHAITVLLLPTIAARELGASDGAVALLYGLMFSSMALFSLPAGIALDRHDKRQALLAANLCAVAVMGVLVALASADALSMPVVAFATMVVAAVPTVGELAAETYLPTVSGGDVLQRGNALLVSGRALAATAAPVVAGVGFAWGGAAPSLAVNLAAFTLAAVPLVSISARRTAVTASRPGPDRLPSSGVGRAARLIRNDPVLRRVALGTGLFNVGGGLVGALYVVFAYRNLALSPVDVGILEALGSVAIVAGGLTAMVVIRWLGIAATAYTMVAAGGLALWLIPLAGFGAPLLALAVYETLFGVTVACFRVAVISLRQSRVSCELQGATFGLLRIAPMAGAPLGAFAAAGLVSVGVSNHVGVAIGSAIACAALAMYGRPADWRSAVGAARDIPPVPATAIGG